MLFVMLLVLLGTPAVYLLSWIPGMRYTVLTRFLYTVPFVGSIASAFALDAVQGRLIERPKTVWITLASVIFLLMIVTVIVLVPQRDEIVEQGRDLLRQARILTLFMLIGLGGWVVAVRRPAWGAAVLVLVSGADLVSWGMPFNPVNSLEILYPENPITGWLRQQPGLYRVLPLQSDRVVFGPNVLSVFHFQEPGGYSSQIVSRYRQLGKAISDRIDIWWMAPNSNMLVYSEFDPMFSMLNVKFVLSSYQRPERITAEVVPADCLNEVPLRQGELVTQEFQIANPGLNRLDLRFKPTQNLREASLFFWLWRKSAEDELVASIPFKADEISDKGEKVFFFAPVPESRGETFVWGVEVVETEETLDLALCAAGDDGRLSFGAYSTQLRFADTLQGVWIYENPNTLPRAYVSHHVAAIPDEETLTRIKEKGFDPWHSVVVASPLSPEVQALTETPLRPPVSPADVVEYKSHRVAIEVETQAPGILVLADAWYPGWRVTVDGQAADLLRTNYALRGVYVDSGSHRVVFQFRPPILRLGAAVTVAALLAVGLLVVVDWRSKR
jgi:hypothetical protein